MAGDTLVLQGSLELIFVLCKKKPGLGKSLMNTVENTMILCYRYITRKHPL